MIEINKASMHVNPSFFERYTVFKAICDRTIWQRIDELKGLVDASCGIREEEYTALYILSKDTKKEVRDVLEKAGVTFKTLSETRAIPLKLVVNAVCKDADFVSLGGRNFYISMVQFTDAKGKLKNVVEVPEVWVSKEGCISIHSVTFKKWREGEKGPYYSYKNGELVKTAVPSGDDSYVIGGLKGKRASVLPFFAVSEAGYIASRAAMIRSIIYTVNRIFEGDIDLSFEHVEDTAHFQKSNIKKCMEDVDKMIERQFEGSGIESDIPEVFDYFDVPKGNEYKIKLIESKDTFEDDDDDPYESLLNVQHVTFDTYDSIQGIKSEKKRIKTLRAIVKACLIELSIKKDICMRKDSFNTHAEEIICVEQDAEKGLFWYCKREREGGLTFGSFTAMSGRPDFVPPEVLAAEEKYILIREGSVLGIRDTEYIPLPSERVLSEIVKTHGKIRGKEKRDELLGGLLDIHLYEYQGRFFYYSASIGKGMDTKIPKASTLMELVPYTGNSHASYVWLFDLLGVTYINAGNRFTKLPYLFKYLREWKNAEDA